MTWYRFFVKSNGGEQEAFRWYDGEHAFIEDDLKSLASRWAETTPVGRCAEHYTFDHEQVDTLPEEARQKMFEQVKARLRFNSMLLDKLREDDLQNIPTGKEMVVLNQEVTSAIIVAEELDQEAARAWERVWRAEENIARYSPPGIERSIALEGVKTAKAKARRRREHR